MYCNLELLGAQPHIVVIVVIVTGGSSGALQAVVQEVAAKARAR
jgi:hypothetical protein